MRGVGVGLRPPHYQHVLEKRPRMAWFEAISENFLGTRAGNGGRPISVLERIRKDYPVSLHGVSLSIGSADPLDLDYLKRLKALAQRVEPDWVSDHLCWTSIDGENLHDLLPLPHDRESLDHVVTRVEQVQELLDRRILIENVSSYLSFTHSEMPEWEFLSEVSARSGCGLLLDINNVYVNAVNHGFDPLRFLEGIPPDRVGQLHLAGHSDLGTHLIDTHDHPVCEAVWDLYAKAVARFGPVPTLIEWDARIPEFHVLQEEAEKAAQLQESILADPSAFGIPASLIAGASRPGHEDAVSSTGVV